MLWQFGINHLVSDLTPDQKSQIQQFKAGLGRFNKEQIQQYLTTMMEQADAVPEEQRVVMETIRKLLQKRLAELEEGGNQ